MGREASDHRAEVDREEADKLWTRVTEIDEKVGVIDKSVATLTSEVHGLSRGVIQLGGTVNKVAEDVAKSNKELVEEINRGKAPNWQMLQVIGPIMTAIIMAVSFIFYREIEHVRGEADHIDHIHNLKNEQQLYARSKELEVLEWKMRCEQLSNRVK